MVGCKPCTSPSLIASMTHSASPSPSPTPVKHHRFQHLNIHRQRFFHICLTVKMSITIRPETVSDIPSSQSITTLAFSTPLEANILSGLRNASALTLSLVATLPNSSTVVGHVAFSPVTVPNATNWVGLGPISVHPDYQRKGVGSKLIVTGIELLKRQGINGCVLLGNPDYYKRFGFVNTALRYDGVEDQKYFMAMVLNGDCPAGSVQYHPAFDIPPPKES